jgi:hypothetical protein
MTISSTTVRNSYSGDGTTDTFTYNFKIFQDSDIQVIIRSANGTETIKTITTHYTVTDAGVSAGGTVVFTAGNIPTATETVVLRRNIPQTQAIDYIANDPFPAESHEEGLDRATMAIQQIQEEVTRSLKLSKTNTMTSTEFTVGAADRANKILAFDASGEISVTQELGTYKGTDTTITTEAYVQRDIVKSTSATQLNNVYICVGDSVVGDLLTDTDHFDLLVDAVSAAASATAAASSATDAETAQTAAETAQTAAETAQTAAELAETNAETAETNAETAETNAETAETNAAASEAAAAASEANAATSETNAATSESNASTSASTATTQAGIATTQAGIATTQAGNASTSASNASTSESNAATSESNAATSASNAATSESNAAASAASAVTLLDNFDDVYLGSKTTDPTLDNDGDALTAGDLYYNSVGTVLKYYTGSAWVAITAGGITDLVQDTSPQLGGMLDVNGQAIGDGTLELVKFAETASAVNEITVTNAATTAAPEISATGDDTDIDLKLTPKGAGKINLDGIKFPNADGTANQILKTDGSGVLSFTDAFTGIAWQSVQTTGFTASAGNAYPCNTTSAGFTVTLPATPSAGQQVQIVDYAGTFDTNALVIDPNGEDIEGGTDNLQLTGEREGVILTYIDSTQGWIATSGINEGTDALSPTSYSIDFLVVAGGAGGAGEIGGGGGAGGYRSSTQTVNIGTVITVTVGDGGSGSALPGSVGGKGGNGSNSSISGSSLTTITSAGGGGGGTNLSTVGSPTSVGNSGGSGGGGAGSGEGPFAGGSGNTPSTSPSQGNNGGTGSATPPNYGAAGGGGASAVGNNGTGSTGGNGGAGTASSITGSSITRAGGGGGATYNGGTPGSGGAGGGGAAAGSGTATSGTTNTGGGGGGCYGTGGSGGKGVVILSMPLANFSSTTTGSPTESTSGSNKILVFTGDGSYTA